MIRKKPCSYSSTRTASRSFLGCFFQYPNTASREGDEASTCVTMHPLPRGATDTECKKTRHLPARPYRKTHKRRQVPTCNSRERIRPINQGSQHGKRSKGNQPTPAPKATTQRNAPPKATTRRNAPPKATVRRNAPTVTWRPGLGPGADMTRRPRSASSADRRRPESRGAEGI